MDIKSFFCHWCLQNKVVPRVIVVPSNRGEQRLFCEIRIEGIEYVGCGYSDSDNDAETIAAKDFIRYLIGENLLDILDVPRELRVHFRVQTATTDQKVPVRSESIDQIPSNSPCIETGSVHLPSVAQLLSLEPNIMDARPSSFVPYISRSVQARTPIARPLAVVPSISEPIQAGPSATRPSSVVTSTTEAAMGRQPTSGPSSFVPYTAEPVQGRPSSFVPYISEPVQAGQPTTRSSSIVSSTSEAAMGRQSMARPSSVGPCISEPLQARQPTARPFSVEPYIADPSSAGACDPHMEGRNDTAESNRDAAAENAGNFFVNIDNGNWTVDNAKSKLHQFLQKNNIQAEYQYSTAEIKGNMNFIAQLSIYVPQINRILHGQECGASKLMASKYCALSIVLQLYKAGVIEAFNGSLKLRKERNNDLVPYAVRITPELKHRILDVLNDLNIQPKIINGHGKSKRPITIINTTVIDEFLSRKEQPAEILPWSPPSANWDPWLSRKISEDPLVKITLKDLSNNMETELLAKFQEEVLWKKIKERQDLPIYAYKKEIMKMINENPVCIIRGNTGCGKTTQVGQFILDHYVQTGKGAQCNVVVTQPRRISAISSADRVAEERAEVLGKSVGYAIRFESIYPRPQGSILFCTVGTFLKKLEYGLQGISHVIVDEIHERDLKTDFILTILRNMSNSYPDLKLILMSATIDTTMFCNYFSGCPVFDIPGQIYPVREYFLEDIIDLVEFYQLDEISDRNENRDSKGNRNDEDEEDFLTEDGEENLNLKISSDYSENTKRSLALLKEKEINFTIICEILKYIEGLEVKGAVLIFLPGWNIIMSLMRHLQQSNHFGNENYVIFPLHSCLSTEDQKRVFEVYPPTVTKIILSTNIAETSITINDIVYVIDSCKTKVKVWTPEDNLTQFTTTWASKANLKQRRGRAGRTRPGYCFRLCSRARYDALEEYTTPEMLRSRLDELALTVKNLCLGPIREFLAQAPEPPPPSSVKEAMIFLHEMKYLNDNNELTPLGKIISRLPIEPRLGRMLILGILFNCANTLCTIAANNAISGVFQSTGERKSLTYKQRGFSGFYHSDHIAMINAFHAWERAKGNDTDAKLCQSAMLSESALKLTADAKHQLFCLLTNNCGFPGRALSDQFSNYQGRHKDFDIVVALLSSGLYPNIAYHVSKRKLLTAGNKFALIGKRSVICHTEEKTFPSPYFVYGERVKTKVVSCTEMTMVTPLSLLLFGARRVEYVKGVVKLDGWIKLNMDPSIASSIVALRPALENLIVRAAREPSEVMNLSRTDEKLLDVIRDICRYNAGHCDMRPFDFNRRYRRQDYFRRPRRNDRRGQIRGFFRNIGEEIDRRDRREGGRNNFNFGAGEEEPRHEHFRRDASHHSEDDLNPVEVRNPPYIRDNRRPRNERNFIPERNRGNWNPRIRRYAGNHRGFRHFPYRRNHRRGGRY